MSRPEAISDACGADFSRTAPGQDYLGAMREEPNLICPYCGQPTRILYIHSHGQCERCGTTLDECCRGEQGVEEASEDLPTD